MTNRDEARADVDSDSGHIPRQPDEPAHAAAGGLAHRLIEKGLRRASPASTIFDSRTPRRLEIFAARTVPLCMPLLALALLLALPFAPAAAQSDGEIRQVLLSSAWCSFSYNNVSGASRSERVQFFPNGSASFASN